MMHLKREKKESKMIGNESNKALLSDNFSARSKVAAERGVVLTGS